MTAPLHNGIAGGANCALWLERQARHNDCAGRGRAYRLHGRGRRLGVGWRLGLAGDAAAERQRLDPARRRVGQLLQGEAGGVERVGRVDV